MKPRHSTLIIRLFPINTHRMNPAIVLDQFAFLLWRMAIGSRHNLSLEELERCVAVLAYAVAEFGRDYASLLDVAERELELARQEDPVLKARRILEAYTRDGGVKAIFASTAFLKAKV